MRIAALYDIHGNLPALEAVLDEVVAESAELVVVGGDVVPGPMPVECLTRLADLEVPTRFLYGNGERDVLTLKRGAALLRVPTQFHPVLEWVGETLPMEMLQAMAAWPATQAVDHPVLGRVLFCHATPRDDNELFTARTPEERLRPVFDAAGAAVVVCGHTHMQFDRTVGDVRVVNAGSVGLPFGSAGAFWALLSDEGVELRRTAYDVDEATARIQATEYPQVAPFEIRNPSPADYMEQMFEANALR